ncbi:hypothetical protein PoB_001311300 [Plakobranchus ocellatus]|uniref:Uncharacterized protein n=1 Tax=Plakobranchus ocellatus TaxID=259542 RepID=A0AAV3YW30_9GAST|nr:hypothetical protein PoB_001311300 [Plakobranchus ocellatus]
MESKHLPYTDQFRPTIWKRSLRSPRNNDRTVVQYGSPSQSWSSSSLWSPQARAGPPAHYGVRMLELDHQLTMKFASQCWSNSSPRIPQSRAEAVAFNENRKPERSIYITLPPRHWLI